MTNKNIKLKIQPVYNIVEKNVCYAEILVREYCGIKGAFNIIKNINDNKNWIEFDMSILKKSLNILELYSVPCSMVGINLFGETIATKGIAEEIVRQIRSRKLNNVNIVLEFNESTDFLNKTVQENIIILHENNVTIAMDDFGTSKANLSVILGNFVDIVKIDKCFVDMIGDKSRCGEHVLEILIGLFKHIGLRTIVEGVETTEQLDLLRQLGYEDIQGYIYSKPMDIELFYTSTIGGTFGYGYGEQAYKMS